jgi:hypothetical protein
MQLKTVIVLLAALSASADLPNWDVDPNWDAPVDTAMVGFSKAVLKVPNGYCAGACGFFASNPFCAIYAQTKESLLDPANTLVFDTLRFSNCRSSHDDMMPNLIPQISSGETDLNCPSYICPITRDYFYDSFVETGRPYLVSFGHYWCEQACLAMEGCIGFSANPWAVSLWETPTNYQSDRFYRGTAPGICSFYFESDTIPEDCLTGTAGSSWTAIPPDPNYPDFVPWNTYFLTCPWKTVVGAPGDALSGCSWNSATNLMQCDSSFGGVTATPSPAWAPTSAAECENLCKYNHNVGFPNGAQCNTWSWNNGVCTAYTATASANSLGTVGSYGYNWLGCRSLSGQSSTSDSLCQSAPSVPSRETPSVIQDTWIKGCRNHASDKGQDSFRGVNDARTQVGYRHLLSTPVNEGLRSEGKLELSLHSE